MTSARLATDGIPGSPDALPGSDALRRRGQRRARLLVAGAILGAAAATVGLLATTGGPGGPTVVAVPGTAATVDQGASQGVSTAGLTPAPEPPAAAGTGATAP